MTEQVPSKEKVALEYFSAYFEQNYYGTVVFSDPRWHAPKVFRAAMWALQQAEKDAGDPIVKAIHKVRERGCGDNSCIHGRPSGMGTNGGCSCKKAPPKTVLATLRALRDEAEAHGPVCLTADNILDLLTEIEGRDKEITRLQREVDYCVINHDAQLTKYRTALEEICTRRRCPLAEKALGLSDSPCGCPRDSFGHVKCEERSGPEHTYCVAERNAEDSHEQ
jgi:hypothetical protein